MQFPGDELRLRRIEAGLSRVDVYKKLHIPVQFTEALEENTPHEFPPLTYSLGFLRTYCRFLRLDPEPYLAALQATTHAPRNFLGITKNNGPAERPTWCNELIMWVTIISIVVLGWFAYTAVFQPSADAEQGSVRAGTLDLRLPDALGPL